MNGAKFWKPKGGNKLIEKPKTKNVTFQGNRFKIGITIN